MSVYLGYSTVSLRVTVTKGHETDINSWSGVQRLTWTGVLSKVN